MLMSTVMPLSMCFSRGLTGLWWAVNELYGRTFAIWTLTTCVLCLICAKNPCVPAIYGKGFQQLTNRSGLQLCSLPILHPGVVA